MGRGDGGRFVVSSERCVCFVTVVLPEAYAFRIRMHSNLSESQNLRFDLMLCSIISDHLVMVVA